MYMASFRENTGAQINLKYLPSEKIQAMRKFIYLRYSQMKDSRVRFEKDWDRAEKQYEAWRPDKELDDWQSNIVPPFTTSIVERILAETVDNTIQPIATARGSEDVPKAKVINYIKDYTWEQGFGDLELYDTLKQALIKGKTIWQEDYWKEVRKVKMVTSFDWEKNEEVYDEVDLTEYDDVYGEMVPLEEFFIDEKARTVNRGRQRAREVIRRYIMPLDAFRARMQGTIWDQFDAVKYVKPGGDTNYYQFYKPPEGIDKGFDVEVLFYHSRAQIPGNGSLQDWFCVVANDVVTRANGNPFNHKQLPFAEGEDVSSLNQFYAKGEPKLLESLQDELTTMRRMRVDRQHLDIWKMFLASNRETLTDQDAIVAPSKFLFVDDPNNSIKPLEYGDINPSAYREEALLKDDGREVTGMQSPQPTDSATEAAIFKESTMKQVKMKIWHWSRELVTQIAMLRVPNIVQFYQTQKVERILGAKDTAKYKEEIERAEKENALIWNNGVAYKKSQREIRTGNVSLELTRDGKVVEKKMPNQDNFFKIPAEMLIPYKGGFDLKLMGDATLPISKPLQQQKMGEFFQHPVITAAIKQGYYDVGKAADKLTEINDIDPMELKPDSVEAETDNGSPVKIEELLELATTENKMLMQGQRIPGTPYATREHTDIHLAFMESEEWKTNATQEIIANFSYHIMMEAKAIEARENASGKIPNQQVPGQPSDGSEANAVAGSEAQAMAGAKAVGPTQMAPGMSIM